MSGVFSMLGMNGGEVGVVAAWWRGVGVADAASAGRWLLGAARRMCVAVEGLPDEYEHFNGDLQTEIMERLKVADTLQFWAMGGGARNNGDDTTEVGVGGIGGWMRWRRGRPWC